MRTKKNGDVKIFQGKIHTNSCHSCETRFYICAKEGPNKGSSLSPVSNRLEYAKFTIYFMEVI